MDVGKTHLFLTISGHNPANTKVSVMSLEVFHEPGNSHIFTAIWSNYRKTLIQATLRKTSFPE